jgi:hypothetical protein
MCDVYVALRYFDNILSIGGVLGVTCGLDRVLTFFDENVLIMYLNVWSGWWWTEVRFIVGDNVKLS